MLQVPTAGDNRRAIRADGGWVITLAGSDAAKRSDDESKQMANDKTKAPTGRLFDLRRKKFKINKTRM